MAYKINVRAELCTAAIKAAQLKDSKKSFPEPLIHGHRVHYEGTSADQR